MFYNELIITDKCIIVKIISGVKTENGIMTPLYKTHRFLRSEYRYSIDSSTSENYIDIINIGEGTGINDRSIVLEFPQRDTIIINKSIK